MSALQRRDRTLNEALRDRRQVMLWFEHDLYDQLQLLDALAVASTSGGTAELIVAGSFPGKPSFRGLGELTAAEPESLWPSRAATAPGMLVAAAAAWDALRRPEPSALAALATAGAAELAELPFLAAALRRLLEELPAPGDGLSGPNGGPYRPSRPARRHRRRRSAPRRTSRRRRSSATHGSDECAAAGGRRMVSYTSSALLGQ